MKVAILECCHYRYNAHRIIVFLAGVVGSFCDDGNNNGGCDWDGGDCCDVDASFAYCTEYVSHYIIVISFRFLPLTLFSSQLLPLPQ